MSAEVIEKTKNELLSLVEHTGTLNKDTPEYDQAVGNIQTMAKALTEQETAEAERIRKDKERIQAIKEWEADQKLKEADLDERHAQFMIKTITDSVLRIVEDALYIDVFDRELLFEKDDSRSFKFGGGIISRIPWLRRK